MTLANLTRRCNSERGLTDCQHSCLAHHPATAGIASPHLVLFLRHFAVEFSLGVATLAHTTKNLCLKSKVQIYKLTHQSRPAPPIQACSLQPIARSRFRWAFIHFNYKSSMIRTTPSQGSRVRVIVVDDKAPTAVITAPERVPFGSSFTLSGERSVEAGGGKIVKYIWTLVS